MKKLFVFVFVMLIAVVGICQNNYWHMPFQTAVYGQDGKPLVNQTVNALFEIVQPGGNVIFSDEKFVTTSAKGIATFQIGQLPNIKNLINLGWNDGIKFLVVHVDVDFDGTFDITSTSQIGAVPMAMYASVADSTLHDKVEDADHDPNNEIQTLSLLGSGLPAEETWLQLSGGPAIRLFRVHNGLEKDPFDNINIGGPLYWNTSIWSSVNNAYGFTFGDLKYFRVSESNEITFTSNKISLAGYQGGNTGVSIEMMNDYLKISNLPIFDNNSDAYSAGLISDYVYKKPDGTLVVLP